MQVIIEPLMKVTIGSHFFKVTQPTPRIVSLMLKFTSKLVQMEYQPSPQGNVLTPGKVFGSIVANNLEFRYHIGLYKDFVTMLHHNFIEPNLYALEILPIDNGQDIKITMNPDYTVREDQKGVVDFIIADDKVNYVDWVKDVHSDDKKAEQTDLHSRMVGAPTGSGKTVMASFAVTTLKKRVAVAVLPKYMDKWKEDLVNLTDLTPKDIMPIQGGENLKALIAMAKNGHKLPKAIVFSLTTLRNYFKAYEEGPEAFEAYDYECPPDELLPLLGIGVVVIDETHEHLHAVYKLLSYSHVEKVIALSGTLLSPDPFIERMQLTMFPKEIRYNKIKMKKYIKVYAISYIFKDMMSAKIRTTNFGSNMYSHLAFEKSILKKPANTNGYMDMIAYLVKQFYSNDREPGDKLAVYASSIEMCTVITKFLQDMFPDLDVRRFCEKDPYENAIKPDIRVTTLLSCGTAFDIPGLVTVIMTNSIKSPTSNLQVLGRLRHKEGKDMKFVYLFCEQIRKQVDYHFDKRELFAEKSSSIKEFRCPVAV